MASSETQWEEGKLSMLSIMSHNNRKVPVSNSEKTLGRGATSDGGLDPEPEEVTESR